MPISQTIPTYRQLNPKGFYAPNDELIEEGVAFEYEGEPNMDMEPLNDPALEALKKHAAKLEAGAREVAEKNGRAYVPGITPIDLMVANATADARRIELRKGDGGIPVMGMDKRGQGVNKVDLEIEEPVFGRRGPGRPRKIA